MLKSIGIVRKVDPLGRVVLPKELRRTFSINDGTPLEIFVDNKRIVLQKYEPGCLFCGSQENLVNYKSKAVCDKCVKAMARV